MMTLRINQTDLDLGQDEHALLHELCLDIDELVRAQPREVTQNGERVLTLLAALEARGAIPEHRVRYFTHPDYYPGGRKRSLKEIYEDNGTRGDDIARHPPFVKIMRYFLNGPDLSASVKREFSDAVQHAGGEITGSEVIEVANAARRITREHGLQPHAASDEFFKLALEHGAHPMWAKSIYERVRTTRVR